MTYTLRDLPLPVKVVATVFLMAVGVGYGSAMVQLHMQDSKSGEPMPTVHDVVLKYTGKKWFEGEPPRPVSKLERLVMGSIAPDAVFNGTGSMGPAFFTKDPSVGPKKYTNLVKAQPDRKAEIDAQREGERRLLQAWLNVPDAERRAAYEADNFVPPAGQEPKAIDPDWKAGPGYKVKSIIDTRCVGCHGKGGPQESYPLESYEQLAKYMTVPAVPTVPAGGGWVRIDEPMSADKLTQTTHTHLLSFAMLFSLTGVIFAFSSYPTVVRAILGPWVTVAVVTDVTFWWLARFSDEWGPYFAMGIIGTGGAAGLGLAAQITLSLFNMYDWKGKILVAIFFLLGAGIVSLLYLEKIKPALDAKQSPVEQEGENPTIPPPKNGDTKNGGPPPKSGPSRFDIVLAWPVVEGGKEVAVKDLPFKKDKPGGMVRAFFDREDGYKEVMRDKGVSKEEKAALDAKRHGELAAVKAWAKLAEPQRKSAYDADAFDLPAELKGKPLTEDYVKEGKARVKAILTDRCARCHVIGGDNEDALFDTYENIVKVLAPATAPKTDAGAVNAPAPKSEPTPQAPAPPVPAAEPIPLAKDD